MVEKRRKMEEKHKTKKEGSRHRQWNYCRLVHDVC